MVDSNDYCGLDSPGCHKPFDTTIGAKVRSVAVTGKGVLPVEHVQGPVNAFVLVIAWG